MIKEGFVIIFRIKSQESLKEFRSGVSAKFLIHADDLKNDFHVT